MYEVLFMFIEILIENNDEVYGYELVLQKFVDVYYKVLFKFVIFVINFNYFYFVGCVKVNVLCCLKNEKIMVF